MNIRPILELVTHLKYHSDISQRLVWETLLFLLVQENVYTTTEQSLNPKIKFKLKDILVSFLLLLIILQLPIDKRKLQSNRVRRKERSDSKLLIIPIDLSNSLITRNHDYELYKILL